MTREDLERLIGEVQQLRDRVVQLAVVMENAESVSERQREALELIARGGCENCPGERCWEGPRGLFVVPSGGAEYSAEAWCDACIAQKALDGEAVR